VAEFVEAALQRQAIEGVCGVRVGFPMKTRDDAVQAIRNLLTQLKDNPDSWENPTVDRYLDGMAAWLEDSGQEA
jgi:hypothetical protein